VYHITFPSATNLHLLTGVFIHFITGADSGEGSMLPLWLGTQMYPELFSDVDMENLVNEFFNHWYNYDISAQEIQNTLSGDTATSMTR